MSGAVKLKDIRALRELEGEFPEITDDWLILVGEPEGRERAFTVTIGELRILLAKTPETAS